MHKPRLILTPLNEICVTDVILFNGRLRVIDKMKRGGLTTYVRFYNGDAVWLNNGEKFYAETALQTYARSPRGRQLLSAAARSEQVAANPLRYRSVPELDDGQRRAVAQTREGCAASDNSDLVPNIQQPRASVRMTMGRHLERGQRIAFDVVTNGNERLYKVGGVYHVINPDQYYNVVNDVTK